MKTVYSILLANLFFIATSWSQQSVLVNTIADKGVFGADSDAPTSQKGNIIYRFDKL